MWTLFFLYAVLQQQQSNDSPPDSSGGEVHDEKKSNRYHAGRIIAVYSPPNTLSAYDRRRPYDRLVAAVTHGAAKQ